MKKVFLYAYDGINLGDDLFISLISNRYPHVKFYLWSHDYNKKVFRNIKNIKIVNQESNLLNFFKHIRPSFYSKFKSLIENRCDAVVYIGGSIFIEYDSWSNILNWWEYEASNRKLYILGSNFGPYKTEAYRERLAKILNNVEDICFRDRYSRNLFSDIDKVRYAPDILFDYKFPNKANKKQVFISVIDCASRDNGLDKLSDKEEKYINLLIKYISYYAEKGYNIVLSSFCKVEKDEIMIEKILHQLSIDVKCKVNIVNYDGTNINDLTSFIAESEFIIASRFHASVLGFAANKPVLPIVYSNKTINILKDLSFEGEYIDIREIDDNSYIPPTNIQYEHQMIKNILSIKKRSNEHFYKLDKLLEDNIG